MIWTSNGTQIHAHPVAAGPPIINLDKDTVIFSLSRDEALGLVGEISKGFGIESVPSSAAFDTVNVVIEGAMTYPKELLATLADDDEKATDLKTIRDFLDWEHAVHGSFATEDFHRQLIAEQRPMPTVADARAALTRLEEHIND